MIRSYKLVIYLKIHQLVIPIESVLCQIDVIFIRQMTASSREITDINE